MVVSAEVLLVVTATPSTSPATTNQITRARPARSTASSVASSPARVAVIAGASSSSLLSKRTTNGSSA